jgi:hypothetical protein
MSEDRKTKINIPESIEGYKVTLFWGLNIVELILIFAATLLFGFAIMGAVSRNIVTSIGLIFLSASSLLGIVKVRGRNFYLHLAFVFSYYKNKPRVLIYHHHAGSGRASVQARELLCFKEDDTKTYIFIIGGVAVGIILLILIIIYIYHVIHP